MKNFFKRKNPTLPEPSAQSAEGAGDNGIGNTPVGGGNNEDVKYTLLITAQDNSEQAVVESILRSARIPYIIRERDSESWMRVMIGYNVYGTDIFVPESLLDDASALLVPESGDGDGDGDTDAATETETETETDADNAKNNDKE